MSPPDFTLLRDSPPEERLATYWEWWDTGVEQYGPSCFAVQRVPGDIYIKRVSYASQEAAAMNIVKEYTNIPVPTVLDVVDNLIVMTRLPGQPLGEVFYYMDAQEVTAVQDSLAGILDQLRSIPCTVEGAVSGPLPDMPCCDINRVYTPSGLTIFGPFDNTAAFHDFLLKHIPPSAAAHLLPQYKTVHADKQRVYFTHGDLNLRNILFENGQVTGILDWTCAGWYPGYWEHVKAVYPHRGFAKWRELWTAMFPQNKDAYGLEEELWKYTC